MFGGFQNFIARTESTSVGLVGEATRKRRHNICIRITIMSREEIHEMPLKCKPAYANICPKYKPPAVKLFRGNGLVGCILSAEVVLLSNLFFFSP